MSNHRNVNQCYQDGYNDGFNGKRDKSEMYFQNWGRKAAEDYGQGYALGYRDYLDGNPE